MVNIEELNPNIFSITMSAYKHDTEFISTCQKNFYYLKVNDSVLEYTITDCQIQYICHMMINFLP